MDSDYRIAIEDGFIRIECMGLAYYEFTRDMLAEVGALAASTQRDRLLFDVRSTNYRDSHVTTIRHAEEAADQGIDPSFRIAVLGLKDDPMLQYVEDVSVNRGYRVRAFVDEGDAVKWLRDSS
jgi:hypothetical protein